MAHPQIAVFARLADGQAERLRAIEGQKTLLGRTMHAIAYDEIHDEMYVTQQFSQGILVFRGSARGVPGDSARRSCENLAALDEHDDAHHR